MKVLFVVDKFPSFSETFIRDQIINLIDSGIDVGIYSMAKQVLPDERESLKGFESYRLLDRKIITDTFLAKNKIKRVFLVLLVLLKAKKKHLKFYLRSLDYRKYGNKAKSLWLFYFTHYVLCNNIKIIHSHYGTNGNKTSYLKDIGLPLKLIVTFHGYDIRLGYDFGRNFYNILKRNGDRFISISNYNRKSLNHFGFNMDKVVDLPNGIDTIFFKRVKPANTNGILRFLTVARLVPEKNIALALKAFNQIINSYPDIQFKYTIVGEGILKNDLLRLCSDLNLEKSVEFVGRKNSMQVRDYMINSDMFILSSKAEALPTVISEAKSCELPILATNVGSVKQMLENCGLVAESENLNSFVNAFKKMIALRESWRIMGENGRKDIIENYDVRKTIKKLICIYNE